MKKDQVCEKLKFWGQDQLLAYFDKLTIEEQKALLGEIEGIDFNFFTQAKALLSENQAKKPCYRAFQNYETRFCESWKKRGENLIQEGKCALLVLAGGSGSRLGFQGPKGCFPITKFQKKSLFQCIAEKVLILSKLMGRPLEMAIMTSPANHDETCLFFAKHHNFGLKKSQVHFFSQKQYPLISLEGHFFLEKAHKIAMGANGNGLAFKELANSEIYKRWKEQNVEYLNVIPVDNPLADPFDAYLFGYHSETQSDVTIKATQRKHPQEKVGVIVEQGQVVEYGQARLENEEKAMAYIGLFCIRFSCLDQLKNQALPLYRAKKMVLAFNGKIEKQWAWKFEHFLFDLFASVEKIQVLCYPRERCFAPLKNFEGDDSIAVVQEQIQKADREAYFQVTGIKPPSEVPFELAFDFYYPSLELKKKWENRPLPNNPYIEAL